MPYLTAHALDRANEWLVRWRLSGRLPSHRGPDAVEHLARLGSAVHPAPASLSALEPFAAEDHLWQAASPWPGAAGRNRRWFAERYPATVGGAGAEAAPTTGAEATPTRPSVILLHGWLMDRPQLGIYRSWARNLAARGLDVWLPRLPYHLERSEPGEVSGLRCLSPELATSLDAVRQAVAETRLLAAWLRRRGSSAVGVWGMSLGGWVAALAATLDDDWDAVVLWAPVASPAGVLFESRLVELLRTAVIDGGTSEGDLMGPEFEAISPAQRRTDVQRAKVMIVAGVYDQVISPRSIVRLARNWNVDVRWVPHGHISLMASRAPMRDTAAFLERTLCS